MIITYLTNDRDNNYKYDNHDNYNSSGNDDYHIISIENDAMI